MEKRLFGAMPQAVKAILQRFDEVGFEAYAVGGCVRDVLLGRTVHDWDLCSSASPEQVTALFSDCRVLPTGEAHGTVTLLHEGLPYEITMFRTESDYDGRKPGYVRPARTIEEDLARRDFTVNAMAYHPEKGLIDCYHGQDDLMKRQLRAVGLAEERFREDYLRILRALRFSACYELSIEENTAKAMVSCAEGLRILSAERVWQELSRLLLGACAGEVLAEFAAVLRGLWGDFSMSEEDGRLLDEMPLSLCGRLALLLNCCGEKEAVLEQLRCPAQVKQRVQLIWKQVESQDKGCRWLSAFWKKYRREDSCAALYLMGQQENISYYESLLDSGIPLEPGELAVNGKDLLELGLKGPVIGQTLAKMLEAVWDENVKNRREELLALIK